MNSHTSTNNNMGSLREMNNLSHQQHQHQFNVRSATDDQPPLNLPRPDLLGREDYNEILVPTYKATITGDWKAAKIILDRRPELVRCSITESCETVLHIAVLGKSYWFVEYLVSLMEKKDLELQNVNGQTALCLAAMAGHVKIAKILVKKNTALLDMPDSRGMMPLYMAVLYGKHEMVKYLYHNSHKMTGDYWTHQNRVCVLVKSVESNLFDVALQIVTDCPELAINESVLALLARKPYAFDAAQPNIIWRIKCSFCHLKFGIPDMESDALQLLRIIWAEIVKLPRAQIDDIIKGPPDETKGDEKQTRSEKDQQETLLLLRTISDNIAKMPARIFNLFKGPSVENAATWKDAKKRYSSRVLFLAAEMGNTAFVVEVIRQYPHLVREVNDHNQSIFHVAVSHRHEGIFNLLYDIGSLRNLIITLEDTNGNNMLHLAGESAKINRLQNIPGVGLQLHLETLWFKQVEAILPPPFREKKNAAGLTPHEVFTKNHKILFSKGEEWMKETAAQLMVVASLIATITFAAAFTFPGGYDQVTVYVTTQSKDDLDIQATYESTDQSVTLPDLPPGFVIKSSHVEAVKKLNLARKQNLKDEEEIIQFVVY
ncbi:ankyrin repeat-containing domain, PGG domain protein [Tanacetum coccineum]